jgi:hypothetical protein
VPDYTFRTVPFRILSPALKLLPVVVTGVLTQVYTKTWEHRPLAAKIVALKTATDALRNPSRNKTLVHLTAWYGVAIELRAALPVEQIGMALALDKTIDDMKWLQPSWEFMQQKMAQQKAAQQ